VAEKARAIFNTNGGHMFGNFGNKPFYNFIIYCTWLTDRLID